MTGWLIQGVRGEGKSLAAVNKAKEYIKKGLPVATNLDLFLEHLAPHDSEVLTYRLPDKPRIEDFQLIGAAYDPTYKGEDKNGLLILDELGTWLNSRSWSDKSRSDVLNWLFLSRKMHWDIILLAQDHEMIDKQAKSTLCDYLVQATRTDRQRIPFFGRMFQAVGVSPYRKKEHVYEVFYGFDIHGQVPVEKWQFLGHDVYEAYDTNQLFTDGNDIFEVDGQAKITDMRATSTNLPASYLTGYKYTKPFQDKLDHIQSIFEAEKMALKGKKEQGLNTVKLALLVIVGVGFVGYRLFTGVELPSQSSDEFVQNQLPVQLASVQPVNFQPQVLPTPVYSPTNHRHEFVDNLVTNYRPRLSAYVFNSEFQDGLIGFYDGQMLIEEFRIKELHALGVAIVRKSYGVDMITNNATYVVSRWRLKPHNQFKTKPKAFIEQGQLI